MQSTRLPSLRYNRGTKDTGRKYFRARPSNKFRMTRERGRRPQVRWLAIFFLLISASVVAAVFSHRNATLYELCIRRVRLFVRPSVCSFVRPCRAMPYPCLAVPSVRQKRAFSAATKLNVRGLWCAELRVVICRRGRRRARVHIRHRSFTTHESAANVPRRTSTRGPERASNEIRRKQRGKCVAIIAANVERILGCF